MRIAAQWSERTSEWHNNCCSERYSW